jgi:G:T-mismatch repair DNA endonuclease (very short patch repair protein)
MLKRRSKKKKLKGSQIKNIILKELILSYFIHGRGWEKFPCRGRGLCQPPSLHHYKLRCFFIWY